MIKPVLYLFEGGEPEEVITGIKNIKEWVDKEYETYLKKINETNSKRANKKVQRDS